jgi:acyl carrier protein
MDTPEKVLAAIYRTVNWINAELPPDRQLSKTPDTRLLGPQSVLDSLHLVSLLINIERELEDTFGVALTLANERALSMKESPFRTLESLASYIEVLLNEAQNGREQSRFSLGHQ